ncbi:hypothetical protein [Gordonia iterans]
MAADDQYLEPVKRTSQEYVWQLLGSAIDHLRLVGESGQRQQESNPFAFCTLIRTAITTASTALWILGADDRATRKKPDLQVVAADYASYIRFRDTVKQGMSTPEEAAAFDREGDILDERDGSIIAEYVAPTAKRRTTLRQVEGEVSDTAMVKSAGALLDASQFAGDIDQGVELVAAWQIIQWLCPRPPLGVSGGEDNIPARSRRMAQRQQRSLRRGLADSRLRGVGARTDPTRI